MIKYIFLYFLLILSPLFLHGQSHSLSGKYFYPFPGEGGIVLEFSEKTFNKNIQGHLTPIIGKGIYQIKSNKLLLKYQNVKNPDTSIVKIETKNIKPSDMGVLSIKVVDASSGKVFPFASCGLRNNKEKLISVILTDTLGKANITLYNFDIIKIISIDLLGYDRIHIPTSQFKGKSVVITAFLKPQLANYIERKEEIYKIEKLDSKELILINEYKKRMRFKRYKRGL